MAIVSKTGRDVLLHVCEAAGDSLRPVRHLSGVVLYTLSENEDALHRSAVSDLETSDYKSEDNLVRDEWHSLTFSRSSI